jgi:hypothetical protein
MTNVTAVQITATPIIAFDEKTLETARLAATKSCQATIDPIKMSYRATTDASTKAKKKGRISRFMQHLKQNGNHD